MCGLTHVTVAVLCSNCSLLFISNSDWTTENEAGRSVCVNGNEEPACEICHQYSSVVTAIIPYLRTIKLQYTVLWDYWVCVRPAWLSVLTWVLSSVPLGTTSKIPSPPGLRRIQQITSNKYVVKLNWSRCIRLRLILVFEFWKSHLLTYSLHGTESFLRS